MSSSPTSQPASPPSSGSNLPPTQAPPASQEPAIGVENADPNSLSFRPNLSFAGATGQDGRRASVQFAPAKTEDKVRTLSPRTGSPRSQPRYQRRLSSPPPPSKYERRVSFNTFDNRDATDYSFTIATKHKDYQYTQRSRTFLCGTDDNEYSYDAIEWLMEELVEDGDEIVCLRVVDKDSKIASDASLRNGTYKKEANDLLEKIRNKNKHRHEEKEKAIVLSLEFAVGKVPEVFQRMISVYAPACLIVGTKGKSPQGMQSFVTGSVSRYCLQNSPVPCIVVRPTRKRIAKRQKRALDEKRQNYQNVLERSGGRGINSGELADGGMKEATEQEARAVAAAIGIPRSLRDLPGLKRPVSTPVDDSEGAPLTRTQSAKSGYTSSMGESPSPTGAFVVSEGNSPEMDPLELSDEGEGGGDEGEDEEDGDDGGDEDEGGKAKEEEEDEEEEEEEEGKERGRTMSQGEERQQRTGAKTFVFPEKRKKSAGG